MNKSSTFDFNTTENDYHFHYIVDKNIIMHLIRINHAVACIYFTDKDFNETLVPQGIQIYSFDFQNTSQKILISPIEITKYVLCWTDNYEIEFNGKQIMCIENQRTWNIRSK